MKHWRWWIALVIAVFAFTIALQLQGYEICKTSNSGHEYCSPHNLVAFGFLNLVDFLNAGGAVITTLATVAIAAFTWTLSIFTRNLGKSTDNLWEAGERQMRLTRESSERQLRAHVFMELVYIEKPAVTPETVFPEPPVVRMQVKNYGQTPAYKVIHWSANPIVREYPLDLSKPLPRRERFYGKSPRMTMGPSQETNKHIWMHEQPTDWELACIKGGSMAIYSWGKIVYKDAFGKWRFTQYMHVFVLGTLIEGKHMGMQTTGEGNKAT